MNNPDDLVKRLGVMATEALSHTGRVIRSRKDAQTLIAAIRELEKLQAEVARLQADRAGDQQYMVHIEGALDTRSWHPIETAPKDGTRVLIYDKHWLGGLPRVHASYWLPYTKNSEPTGSWFGATLATHWMRLPDPPRE